MYVCCILRVPELQAKATGQGGVPLLNITKAEAESDRWHHEDNLPLQHVRKSSGTATPARAGGFPRLSQGGGGKSLAHDNNSHAGTSSFTWRHFFPRHSSQSQPHSHRTTLEASSRANTCRAPPSCALAPSRTGVLACVSPTSTGVQRMGGRGGTAQAGGGGAGRGASCQLAWRTTLTQERVGGCRVGAGSGPHAAGLPPGGRPHPRSSPWHTPVSTVRWLLTRRWGAAKVLEADGRCQSHQAQAESSREPDGPRLSPATGGCRGSGAGLHTACFTGGRRGEMLTPTLSKNMFGEA